MEDYEENYDENHEDEDSEGMLLTIGEDGKVDIHKESEYTKMLSTEINLMIGFIEKNKDLFNEYLKEHDAIESKEVKKGCGKNWRMWNGEEERWMNFGKCRTDILCPKCVKESKEVKK